MLLKIKMIISIILIAIILSYSFFLYRRALGLKNSIKPPTMAKQVQDAKKVASDASTVANKSVSIVTNHKKLMDVVKVGTVLTTEEMTELQTRERDDINAITALQAETSANNKVIKVQDSLTLDQTVKVIIWKIVAGILVAIIVYILI